MVWVTARRIQNDQYRKETPASNDLVFEMDKKKKQKNRSAFDNTLVVDDGDYCRDKGRTEGAQRMH